MRRRLLGLGQLLIEVVARTTSEAVMVIDSRAALAWRMSELRADLIGGCIHQ